jgi:peptidoglycan/LPS O-acetylase OafA/YrhL
MAPRHPIHGIECLRFVLSLMVVLYHYYYYGPLSGSVQAASKPSFALSYLLFAVEAFFVISGFVILLSIGNRRPTEFLIARLSRLGPALFVCSTLTFIPLWHSACATQTDCISSYISSVTVLPLITNTYFLDSSLWSLVYELRFYLAIFLLMFLCNVPHHAFRIAVGMLLCDACFSVFADVAQWNPFFLYMPYFATGILFYGYVMDKRLDPAMAIAFLFAFGLCAIRAEQEFNRVFAMLHLSSVPWWHGIIIASGIFILIFMSITSTSNNILARIFTILGSISYPLYILHQSLGYQIINSAASYGIVTDVRPFVTIAMILVSWLIATLIEPPLMRLYRERMTALVDRFR